MVYCRMIEMRGGTDEEEDDDRGNKQSKRRGREGKRIRERKKSGSQRTGH